MLKFLRSLLPAAMLLIVVTGTAQAGDLSKATGPVVLTVVGKIDQTNRPPFDPDNDVFLEYHEKTFAKAAEFDRAMLEALGVHSATVNKADWPKPHRIEGPWLRDVLAAAGATVDSLNVLALDGYAADISKDDLAAHDWVLGLKRDGGYLKIGQRGPIWIAYAPAGGRPITDDEEAQMVWATFFIDVR